MPKGVAWTKQRFQHIWIVDGSTLEALFRKLNSLQDQPITLAGKIYTIVDLVSHLPVAIRFESNPFAADTNQWKWLQSVLPKGGLLIFGAFMTSLNLLLWSKQAVLGLPD